MKDGGGNWMMVWSAAIIAGGLAMRYGHGLIRNTVLRVVVFAAAAGLLAYIFGREVNLSLRSFKLLGKMF
jgi:hypothetical protein